MTTVANAPAQASPTTAGPRIVRIYEYSDMVYWWAIWFAALIGIVLTYTFGENFQIGDKSLKIHTSPWLGIGFMTVMFGVLIFTHLRARGIYAIIMILALAVIGPAGPHAGRLDLHLGPGDAGEGAYEPGLLRGRVRSLVRPLGLHRLHPFPLHIWLRQPGRSRLALATDRPGRKLSAAEFSVTKRSDDIIVHTLLGLRFLGLGTGDIEVKFDVPGGGSQHHCSRTCGGPIPRSQPWSG